MQDKVEPTLVALMICPVSSSDILIDRWVTRGVIFAGVFGPSRFKGDITRQLFLTAGWKIYIIFLFYLNLIIHLLFIRI